MDGDLISSALAARLREFQASGALLSVLTGAGISAASGIPTFRGKEGYWVVGSRNYQPQEISTLDMFERQPLEVWKWFLFRKTMCAKARPNDGHHAIVELERIFGDRFRLITQNVDGLHQAAGSSEERLLSIHGDLRHARCSDLCSFDLYEFPEIPKQRGEDLTPAEIERLRCPQCGEYLRPHVLWFDETYNEPFYKLDTTLAAAGRTGLLVIVGTSGATNLPFRIVDGLLRNSKVTLIDINIEEDSLFGKMLAPHENGFPIVAESSAALGELVRFFRTEQ
ncbi:MAG: hypothetical protein NXI24_23100 [bacterium]|nr:hypothetical protein [bacterium]